MVSQPSYIRAAPGELMAGFRVLNKLRSSGFLIRPKRALWLAPFIRFAPGKVLVNHGLNIRACPPIPGWDARQAGGGNLGFRVKGLGFRV